MKMNDIYERLKGRETSLAVVGLGYVGLPVALEFARHFNVTGYDIDNGRIASLEKIYGGSGVSFTSSENALGGGSLSYHNRTYSGGCGQEAGPFLPA